MSDPVASDTPVNPVPVESIFLRSRGVDADTEGSVTYHTENSGIPTATVSNTTPADIDLFTDTPVNTDPLPRESDDEEGEQATQVEIDSGDELKLDPPSVGAAAADSDDSNDSIQLVHNKYMNIFFKHKGSGTMNAIMAPFATVETLKAVIHNKIYVAPEDQYIRFKCKVLDEDHKYLIEYGLENDSNLGEVTLEPLKGGAKTKKVNLKSKPVVVHIKPLAIPTDKMTDAGNKLVEIQRLDPATLTADAIIKSMGLDQMKALVHELEHGKSHVDKKILAIHEYTNIGKSIIDAKVVLDEALTRLSGIHYEVITKQFEEMNDLITALNREIGRKAAADVQMV